MIVKLPLVNGCIDCGVGSTIPRREKSKVTIFPPKEIGLNAAPSGPLFLIRSRQRLILFLSSPLRLIAPAIPHIFLCSHQLVYEKCSLEKSSPIWIEFFNVFPKT